MGDVKTITIGKGPLITFSLMVVFATTLACYLVNEGNGEFLMKSRRMTSARRTARFKEEDLTKILTDSGQVQYKKVLINYGLDKPLFISEATEEDVANAGIPNRHWHKIKKATDELLLRRNTVELYAGKCPVGCQESGLMWGSGQTYPICKCEITLENLMPKYFVSHKESCSELGCSKIKTMEICEAASRWLHLGSQKASLNMERFGFKRPHGCHYRESNPGQANDLWFNPHRSNEHPTYDDMSICYCSSDLQLSSTPTPSALKSPSPTDVDLHEDFDV